MSEPVAEQDSPPPNNFEQELADLLAKHQLVYHAPKNILSRYLIRQLDNFRETLQEIKSDDIRQQSTMGSETKSPGS